ncbi:MAG: HD domain-containing protein [Candidatus Paceibacterota bacterium]
MHSLKKALSIFPARLVEIFNFVVLYNEFRYKRRAIYTVKDTKGEPLGEHTDQIAMAAMFIRDRFLPHLNAEKVLRYALLHDLVEVYGGDTPAFPDKDGAFGLDVVVDHTTKKEREHKALERLKRELDWPEAFATIETYEQKADEESRFVYALDKFIADLNIFEDGGRTNRVLKVTYEEKLEYKWHKIAEHPFLLDLYGEFCRYCKEHESELYFQPTETAAE